MTHKRLYSFVIDPRGEFLIQAHMLVWSLTKIVGVAPENIVAHVVGEPDAYSWRDLRALGVPLEQIPPYPDHPWCNKLQQLASLRSRDFDDVVLLDCDVVVLQEPPQDLDAVQAKPVDTGNPPLPLLQEIFRRAEQPLELAYSTATHEPTARANANGGVYVIPRSMFDRLASAWLNWAAWCMERKALFADKVMHIDQVSFALAISSAQLRFKELHPKFNLPTHLSLEAAEDCLPGILHYHRNVDLFHNVQVVHQLQLVNEAIHALNAAWLQHFRHNFRGTSYWNFRLKQYPNETLYAQDSSLRNSGNVKRECVQFASLLTGAQRILDIGTGDGDTVSCIQDDAQIVALDYAIESKIACGQTLPTAAWVLHDIRYPYCPAEPVDLVLCLDVLPHASSREEYFQILDNVCTLNENLLISGYDADPAHLEPCEYFHESLTRSLEARDRVWLPLTSHDNKTIFFSPKRESSFHPRDIRNETLQSAVPLVDDHVLLLESIFTSRRHLGFFPDHLPRCIEYPWILNHLPMDSGRIIDAGAGVSVLPLMLSDRGFDVITVDSHPLRRRLEERREWTEWGFLDYSELDSRIQSINAPYEEIALSDPVDAIVSVSVVEHLTASARSAWFRVARHHLLENGLLLLTIDTVPHTSRLWNYSEGEVVEDEVSHGDLEQLQMELMDAGFTVDLVELINWLPQSRVGMARIIARATTHSQPQPHSV